MARDRVPGYTNPVPPLQAPPRRKTPLGLTGLTQEAIRRATPQPGRSLTPHTISASGDRDDGTTPDSPAAMCAAEHEQLRGAMQGLEARAYLHADSKVAQCRANRTGQTALWVTLGASIVAGVAAVATAIGVATVDNAGPKMTARALNDSALATAGLKGEISQLRRELRAMREEQREDRADLLARIASRPLPRATDTVRRTAQPAPAAPVHPEIERPNDYGF